MMWCDVCRWMSQREHFQIQETWNFTAARLCGRASITQQTRSCPGSGLTQLRTWKSIRGGKPARIGRRDYTHCSSRTTATICKPCGAVPTSPAIPLKTTGTRVLRVWCSRPWFCSPMAHSFRSPVQAKRPRLAWAAILHRVIIVSSSEG